MPFQLQIPRRIFEAMLAHALAERPNECCGLLAGDVQEVGGQSVGRVARHYPLVNVAEDPSKEYLSDDRAMFEAVRDMRRDVIDVLAVYHSHPTSEPLPSRKDLAQNYSPDVVNLIVSLVGEEPRVRGWWLTETDYHEADWCRTDIEP